MATEKLSDEIPEAILLRIKKLQERIAGGVGEITTQNEIEQATKMMTALLLKYNLSMSQINGHTGDTKGNVDHKQYDLNGKMTRHEAGWLNDLFHVIAKYNMCRAISSNPSDKQDKDDMGYVFLIGKTHNIEIVYYLIDQLTIKIKKLCSECWKSYDGEEKRNTYRRGFLRGAVQGIARQLSAQDLEQKTNNPIEGNEMGLMVINNNQLIQKYVEQTWGGDFPKSF